MASDTPPAGIEVFDPRVKALEWFKDWSNYLLITTVAALGWVAEHNPPSSIVMPLAVWCFSISAVFGIFTLALVPLVSEQMKDARDQSSIYLVPAKFYSGSKLWEMYLTQACRPQHVSFILGVVFYSVATTVPGLDVPVQIEPWWRLLSPLVLIATFVLISARSHRRADSLPEGHGGQE